MKAIFYNMTYKDFILTLALAILIFLAIFSTIIYYKASVRQEQEPQATVIEFKPITYTYRVSEFKRDDTLVFIYSKQRYSIYEKYYDDKVELTIQPFDTTIFIK